MVGLGILLAAALACPPIDDVLVSTHVATPVPRLLNDENHLQHHHIKDTLDDAKRQYYCQFPSYEYRENVYFSSAAHTTVVGWRIWLCDGSFHHNGVTSPYCDNIVECCTTNDIDYPPCQ